MDTFTGGGTFPVVTSLQVTDGASEAAFCTVNSPASTCHEMVTLAPERLT